MSELRQDRLETRLGHIEETVARIDERLAATLPHLATKAELADLRTELSGQTSMLRTELTGEIGMLRSEVTGEIGKLRADLADKPSRTYLWGVMTAMVGAQAIALAAAALVFSFIGARQPAAPAAAAPHHAVWRP